MALKIVKGDTKLEGAVKLTEEQAYQYQIGIVRNWEQTMEVFGFRVGPGILSLTSGISAVVLLNHFRTKLRLGVMGRVTSYLPVVAMPSALAALFHVSYIQRNIVLRKYDCPLCVETRAALLQTGIGLVYPLLLAPMASLMYATRHFTVRLPYLTEQPKEWLRLIVKLTRSTKGKLAYILIANLIAGSAVTALEFKEFDNIQMKFEELEKQIESGLISK
ncbi:hypothetical protein PVAND_013025 [Polypedilum vanderplanki]|uniref:Transmembrane protein 126A n=1 Tax=Polypedilum vanderplanki TaxID=319348 RepID=A0A9J6CP73_POLVA|nr:hypothetical protein PVAND_013025 [Polypedilum vanderplanki]